jgi:hypothetical protein
MWFPFRLRTLAFPSSQTPPSRTRPALRRRCASAGLCIDFLEARILPSIFTVTNTLDDGSARSLRWAINQANADTAALATINFNIAPSGMQTIRVGSALPTITHPVVIDGTTEPGWHANALPLTGATAGDNAAWTITLDGSLTGASVAGLTIAAGGSTVRGLVIQNFPGDIDLTSNGNDVIAGNYLTDGVSIDNVPNNTIGGTTADARNVIGGGSRGIYVESNGNVLQGNYIGVDTTGTHALNSAGRIGIFIIGGSYNTIGTPGAGNVIAGWENNDIFMQLDFGNQNPSTNNVVQGNFLGTNAAGTAPITSSNGPDGIGVGVQTVGSYANTIGGVAPGAGNLISGHAFHGIVCGGGGSNVIQGNRIGTDVTGTQAIPNNGGILASSNNTIGGTAAGAGNTIAFNCGPAVSVAGTGNSIEANFIYGNNNINGNTGPAIDNLAQSGFNLGSTFIETNWPGGPFTTTDNSSLANLTLTQTGSMLTYSGTLNGLPNTRYQVLFDLFVQWTSGSTTDFGGYYTYFTTNASGQVAFTYIINQAPSGFPTTQGSLTPYVYAYPPHLCALHVPCHFARSNR